MVKLKRHSSSYETDQGKQPRKVFIFFLTGVRNSRPTCPFFIFFYFFLTGVRTVGLPALFLFFFYFFSDRCQNSRPTCPPVEEQPQASCATSSDDVSANPTSMHKIIDIGNFAGRSLSERDRRTSLLKITGLHLHTIFVWYTEASRSNVSKCDGWRSLSG